MYTLNAINEQGTQVFFNGKTMKECLQKFDSEYYRSGWQIYITNEYEIVVRIVKDTFRKSSFHMMHYGHK